MLRLRYLMQSMNVLNGLLALAVAAGVYYTVVPFVNPVLQTTLPPTREIADRPEEMLVAFQNPSAADYVMISDQNLFHPERRIPPEKKEEKEIPKPEVVLYGTLITDGVSLAFIEDKKSPYSTPGRGKRQMVIKKGDNIGGYVLQQIEPTQILLVKGEEKIVVKLDDKEKRKTGSSPLLMGVPSGGPPPPPSIMPAVPSAASVIEPHGSSSSQGARTMRPPTASGRSKP